MGFVGITRGGCMKVLVFLLCLLFCAGCTSTGYRKHVTVQKDKDGKVQSITVVEEIHQPNLMSEVREFKYLDE